MNAGMTHLAISPGSPYESQNTSRASLVSNLQQQRGITGLDQRPNGASPLSPLGPRAGPRMSQRGPPRVAPVINPNPRSVSGMPDPMAAAPTKGYAWAFPAEPENERRGSSSGDSSVEHSIPSRQNSFAASVNSSIFTTDSNLPTGQKRLDDGTYSLRLLHSAITDFGRYCYHSSSLDAAPQCHESPDCRTTGCSRRWKLQSHSRTSRQPQNGRKEAQERDEIVVRRAQCHTAQLARQQVQQMGDSYKM